MEGGPLCLTSLPKHEAPVGARVRGNRQSLVTCMRRTCTLRLFSDTNAPGRLASRKMEAVFKSLPLLDLGIVGREKSP